MGKHFISAVAIMIALLSSCTKEDIMKPDFDDPGTISSDLQSQLSSVIILYEGKENEFEVAVDDDLCYELYYIVHDKKEADFTYTTTHNVTLNLKRCNDISFTKEGNVVRTSMIPSDRTDFYIATVWKEDNPDEWYPVFLPVRAQEEEFEDENTKSGEPYYYNGKEVSLEARAADLLSHPIYVDTVAKINWNVRWFNQNSLLTKKTMNNNDELEDVISATHYAESWAYGESGSYKDDVTKHLQKNVGLKFSIPIPVINILFNASAQKSTIEDRSSTVEKEWYRWYHYASMMNAAIDYNAIYTNPSEFIGNRLNSALNTIPAPGTRSTYPLTMDGTIQLLKDFGVFISLTGSFGATMQYSYERQANISAYSVQEDAEASLGLSGTTPSSGETPEHYTIGDALMAYVKKIFNMNTTWSADLQMGFSGTQKEYHQAVHSSIRHYYSGGNFGTEPDYTKWAPTDDPSKWNIISFATSQGKEAKLFNIYDMVADYNSPRGKLLKQALWGNPNDESTFLSEDCPYIKAIKVEVKDACYETIIADVIMLDGEYKGNPKSIIYDNGQKSRLYHPLIINYNGGNMVNGSARSSLEGYGFQAGCDNDSDEHYFDFFAYGDHSKNWQNKAISIYYAMDSWSQCSGIDDIVIASNVCEGNGSYGNALKGYKLSGKTLKTVWRDGNDRYMEDCGIYIKTVDESKKTEDYPYVTGISLVAGVRRDGCSSWEPGIPFASSTGTEWYDTSTGNTKSKFDYYWDPNAAKNLYTSVVDENTKQVYILGVNSSVNDRFDSSKQCKYVIKSVDSYYGPTSDDGYKVWWTETQGDQVFSTKWYPALFWSLKNSNADDKNDVNCCVFLNYTTTRLEPDKITPVRRAKTF